MSSLTLHSKVMPLRHVCWLYLAESQIQNVDLTCLLLATPPPVCALGVRALSPCLYEPSRCLLLSSPLAGQAVGPSGPGAERPLNAGLKDFDTNAGVALAWPFSSLSSVTPPACRNNTFHPRLGRHDQAHPLHAAVLPLKGSELHQLQRNREAAGVGGRGPRAHHHRLALAGR